jgi:hypothetical protein
LIYKEVGEVFEEDFAELIKYAKWCLGTLNGLINISDIRCISIRFAKYNK